MGDLLHVRPRPRRHQVEGLTAAARILAPTREDTPTPEFWHAQAWDMRNTTGEVRHAETWLGNQMGRARLFAARRERPGAEPEALPPTHPASVYIDQLAGGVGGQSALLRGFGAYFTTPGVGILCGFDPQDGGGHTWQVRDVTELRLSPYVDQANGLQHFEVQTGDLAHDWMPLGPQGLVVEVHRPHPQRRWKPDSPVRGAMPILSELRLLTQAIEAQATSRLAGAGILPLPRQMELEGQSWDAWIQDFIKAMTTPIKNRASVAATVPFPIKMDGQWVDKIKPVNFSTPFDEHALKLRAELIQRLGTAMDMPVRALTGEQENHWGKAATQEEGVQIHVVPDLELVCDGITRGYLNPAMMGTAKRMLDLDVPGSVVQLIQSEQDGGLQVVDGDGFEILCWYDISQLTTKPDKSDDARDLYDRYEIPAEAYRAEVGLSDIEAPATDERAERLLIKVVEQGTDPNLTRVALVKLGVLAEDEVPPAAGPPSPAGGTSPAPPEPPVPAPEQPGPVPATGGPDTPAPSDQPAPQAAHVALVAAADGFVTRALEKAGNRLRQATARARAADPGLDRPPAEMHQVCIAAQVAPLDRLLDGAWDRVPEVAANLGVCPDTLAETLDVYTRGLLTKRLLHSWQLLDAFLSSAPTLSPVERVLAAHEATNARRAVA